MQLLLDCVYKRPRHCSVVTVISSEGIFPTSLLQAFSPSCSRFLYLSIMISSNLVKDRCWSQETSYLKLVKYSSGSDGLHLHYVNSSRTPALNKVKQERPQMGLCACQSASVHEVVYNDFNRHPQLNSIKSASDLRLGCLRLLGHNGGICTASWRTAVAGMVEGSSCLRAVFCHAAICWRCVCKVLRHSAHTITLDLMKCVYSKLNWGRGTGREGGREEVSLWVWLGIIGRASVPVSVTCFLANRRSIFKCWMLSKSYKPEHKPLIFSY